MPAEPQGVGDALRLWWPLVGAVAGQLLALGIGIEIVRRLRSDFSDHDVKDDDRFEKLHAKLDARIDSINDRITDLRVDVGIGRHER